MSRKAHWASIFFALILLCGITFSSPSVAAEDVIPRTIIALYDDPRGGGDIQNTYIHRLAEMPLNHLGLNVEYHNIREPLPNIVSRKDVRGVITWSLPDMQGRSESYYKWALNAVENGKKYVVMDDSGIGSPTLTQTNRFLSKIGIRVLDRWIENPLGVTYNSPEMFTKPTLYTWNPPSYRIVRAANDQTEVHLFAHDPGHAERDSVLMATNPNGGYISGDYSFRTNKRADDEVSQWMINPFEFFRRAYATDDLPKPDTTTIAGRRIFYSNIDGDGWNNVTQLEEYHGKNVLSARVILEKVVKPYLDLPIMLAIIAAEIDPDWAGIDGSEEAARELLAQPNIEAGSHTYSHPLRWSFFKTGKADDEIPYLPLYPEGAWKSEKTTEGAKAPAPDLAGYSIPRAYAKEPFDIHKEIEGSVRKISEFSPKGKQVEVLAWSGDCSPWDQVIQMTRTAKLQNLNGGDTRSDPDYPGYASVAPIGRQVEKERQIYVSTSNENTYTSLWSENFFAHKYLKTTLKNAETPMRLKPLNIYFHMYAGEREASLNALLSNLDFARGQNITPVTASHFTRIAEGFYDTQFISLGQDKYRIEGRGALETIRFDRHTLKSVDFERSYGVVGQRHYQGSLYVYLDADVDKPIIALKDNEDYFHPPAEETPYLLESRWLIAGLARKKNGVDFTAQGFGRGDMVWQVPKGAYRVSINGKSREGIFSTGTDGLLKLELVQDAITPVHVTIERI